MLLAQITLDMPWKKAKKLIREDPRYKNFTESDHVRLQLAARKPNLYSKMEPVGMCTQYVYTCSYIGSVCLHHVSTWCMYRTLYTEKGGRV